MCRTCVTPRIAGLHDSTVGDAAGLDLQTLCLGQATLVTERTYLPVGVARIGEERLEKHPADLTRRAGNQ